MKNLIFILILFFFNSISYSAVKEDLMKNLIDTQNLNFDFEQNTNGKIESGNCTLEYPKKIFCDYNLSNKKILVSNGKSLVIITKNGNYYRYPIKSTPLNYILDKEFLIKNIKNLNERIIDNKFINFTILKDGNEINIFFDRKNLDIIGWQTTDIYQNLNITYLFKIKKNLILKKNLFKLPSMD